MDVKSKTLYVIYLLMGLCCLCALIVPDLPDIARRLTRDKTARKEFGGLYMHSKVEAFRIPKDRVLFSNTDPVVNYTPDEAGIVFLGDSYFGEYGVRKRFVELSGDRPLYYRFNDEYESPLDVLKREGYRNNGRTRYLVYERVEVNLLKLLDNQSNPESDGEFDEFMNIGVFRSLNGLLEKLLINTKGLEYLVTENPVGNRLLMERNNFRFSTFGLISSKTPVYSLNPPMIFGFGAVGFNREVKSEKSLDELADKLLSISDELFARYGLTMIFMPLPSKYTIYGYRYDDYEYNTSGERYDNFLPRLYRKLDERGVLYVNIYQDFMSSNDLLYYRSDIHWNEKGYDLALKRLIDMMNSKVPGPSKP